MVACVLTRHIKALRVGEHLRVAVCPGKHQTHEPAALHRHAADLGVLAGDANGELHRRVVTKHFVDRVLPAVRFVAQQLQLIRVFVEQDDRVAEQVDRRLEARTDDEQCG